MPDRLAVPLLVLLLLILVGLLVKAVALGLVPERRRWSAATAWLLVIFLVPVLGLLGFIVLGRRSLRRRRPQVQTEARAGMVLLHNNVYPPLPVGVGGPDWLRQVLALNTRLGWLDPVYGNAVELHLDDRAATEAMAAAVAAASRFVHLESPVLTGDADREPLVAALVAARQRGVAVRLAYDDRASTRHPGYAALAARLADAGVVRPTATASRRPRRNLLVVDGRVAFGSAGASLLAADRRRGATAPADAPCGGQLVFQLEGPLVHSLSVVFAADWQLEGEEPLSRELLTVPTAYRGRAVGQVVASGPGLPPDNQLPMLTSLVYGARRRVTLTGPLLTPDEPLLVALTTAARRGVAVEVYVGTEAEDAVGRGARQSAYAGLLEAGVRIFRHPGRLVDRHLSVDDVAVVVGSSGQEASAVSVLLLGKDAVNRFRAVEDHYRAAAAEVPLAAWRKRSLPQRYTDNVLRQVWALR